MPFRVSNYQKLIKGGWAWQNNRFKLVVIVAGQQLVDSCGTATSGNS